MLLPIFVACNGNEEKTDTIDFEEFAGETGVGTEDSVAIEVDTALDLSTEMGQFIYAMSPDYDTMSSSTFHVMDRFSFSSSKKLKFSAKYEVPYGKSNKVTPTADFYYYSFSDSIKTNNAFYNYLDALAEEGEGGPVKLLQDVEAIKTTPMFMVVYDTVIVSAIYPCEHEENNWDAFQDSLLNIYGKKYRYQIDVSCGGPLIWK